MNITPMRDCIFVKPDEAEVKSKGGIILSDFSKKRPTTGIIVAVGPKVVGLKVGERVVYGEFSGAREIMSMGSDEVELMIMTEEDILAIETLETTD